MDLGKAQFPWPSVSLALHKKITLIHLKKQAFAINVVYWPQATVTDISGK